MPEQGAGKGKSVESEITVSRESSWLPLRLRSERRHHRRICHSERSEESTQMSACKSRTGSFAALRMTSRRSACRLFLFPATVLGLDPNAWCTGRGDLFRKGPAYHFWRTTG